MVSSSSVACRRRSRRMAVVIRGDGGRGDELACRVNDGSGWWIVPGESLVQSDDCLQGQTIAKRRSSRRDKPPPRRRNRHLRWFAALPYPPLPPPSLSRRGCPSVTRKILSSDVGTRPIYDASCGFTATPATQSDANCELSYAHEYLAASAAGNITETRARGFAADMQI